MQNNSQEKAATRALPDAPQGIQAITLDLDDTLWPIAPVIERAERILHEWCEQNGLKWKAVVTKAKADALDAFAFGGAEESPAEAPEKPKACPDCGALGGDGSPGVACNCEPF